MGPHTLFLQHQLRKGIPCGLTLNDIHPDLALPPKERPGYTPKDETVQFLNYNDWTQLKPGMLILKHGKYSDPFRIQRKRLTGDYVTEIITDADQTLTYQQKTWVLVKVLTSGLGEETAECR